MHGEINLWWRKSRTKKEGNVTMLPELYDLFLKNVERKHQFPIAMPLIMKKHSLKIQMILRQKLNMYWYQRFRNKRKHVNQSILIQP